MAQVHEIGRSTDAQGSVQARKPKRPKARRLASLDAFRGFVMTMLAASGFGVAAFAGLAAENPVWQSHDYDWWQRFAFHFRHPAWESVFGWGTVSFWDLIQPAFMLMVGVAMPFSYAHREKVGNSIWSRHLHAIVRAIILVLMGVFLYSIKTPQTNWIFTNVLAQIGLGYYFAFVLLGRSRRVQFVALLTILVGYWALFKAYPAKDGYDFAAVNATAESGEIYEGAYRPWSKNGNAAHFFDVWLLNKLRSAESAAERAVDKAAAEDDEIEDEPAAPPVATGVVATLMRWWFSAPERFEFNKGGYTTLSFIPSIATMLLGIFCGQVLIEPVSHRDKLLKLLLWAVTCVGFGLLAHHTVCPIVKRIWTPSWVLFSGGYCIAMLSVFYILFDALPLKKLAFPLVVVGMNSIAMYLMGQMLRPWVIEKVIQVHFGGVLTSAFGEEMSATNYGTLVLPTAAFLVFWLVSFWMHRKRYFVRV